MKDKDLHYNWEYLEIYTDGSYKTRLGKDILFKVRTEFLKIASFKFYVNANESTIELYTSDGIRHAFNTSIKRMNIWLKNILLTGNNTTINTKIISKGNEITGGIESLEVRFDNPNDIVIYEIRGF